MSKPLSVSVSDRAKDNFDRFKKESGLNQNDSASRIFETMNIKELVKLVRK